MIPTDMVPDWRNWQPASRRGGPGATHLARSMFRLVITRREAILKRLPGLALVLLIYHVLKQPYPDAEIARIIVYMVLVYPVFTMFAVGLHRSIILDERPPGHWPEYQFGDREVRYLGVLFAFDLVLLFLAEAFGFAKPWIPDDLVYPYAGLRILCLVAYIYVACRFFVVLPAIAVGHGGSVRATLAAATGYTSGKFWMLLAAMVLTIGPVMILEAAVSSVIEDLGLEDHMFLAAAVGAVFSCALLVLHVVLGSLAFKLLSPAAPAVVDVGAAARTPETRAPSS